VPEDDADLRCLCLVRYSVIHFMGINVQKILAITLRIVPFTALGFGATFYENIVS
jgi:hypothetical protein